VNVLEIRIVLVVLKIAIVSEIRIVLVVLLYSIYYIIEIYRYPTRDCHSHQKIANVSETIVYTI